MTRTIADGQSDSELARLASTGDELAFTRLVDRYQVSVRRLARVMLSSDAVADEVAQDIFLKLWEKRSRLAQTTPPLNVKAYIFAATRNHCVSRLRRRKILQFVGLETEPSQESPPLELRTTLRSAMDKLNENHRTALALRYLEGLDYDEIAALIGRRPEVARSRVHYAIKAIRKHLPEELAP
ncbi:MAG: RNA polymerase sigma factor [Myxococcota bacterium]